MRTTLRRPVKRLSSHTSSLNLRVSTMNLNKFRENPIDEVELFLSPRVDASLSRVGGKTHYKTSPGPK